MRYQKPESEHQSRQETAVMRLILTLAFLRLWVFDRTRRVPFEKKIRATINTESRKARVLKVPNNPQEPRIIRL